MQLGTLEGAVPMIITKRIVVSVDEVTAKLDALARHNRVARHCYDESAADSMSEFDALKWTSLCAQRRALLERETPVRVWSPPLLFRSFYSAVSRCATTGRSSSAHLENKNGVLDELAA